MTSLLHKRVPHSFLQSDSYAMTHQRVSQDSIHSHPHKPRMLMLRPIGVKCLLWHAAFIEVWLYVDPPSVGQEAHGLSRERGQAAQQRKQPNASEFLAHPRDYGMVWRQCPQQGLKDGPVAPGLGKLAACLCSFLLGSGVLAEKLTALLLICRPYSLYLCVGRTLEGPLAS